jgi:hypothetical protein
LLSVIVVTPHGYETIERTMAHLRAQTIHDRLEVLIAAPSSEELAMPPSERQGLMRVEVVEVGPIESSAHSRAVAVRRASAAIVALAEDHSFPQPDWAEMLVSAHRQPWAAVGPVLENANPSSLTSWANLLVEYAPFLHPARAAEAEHLPGHNSSYKRDLLLQYGPELGAMLEAESVLHWDLAARGHGLYLEPAARVRHLNFSRPFSWLGLRFHGARAFAAARSRSWPLWRRVVYACGGPLIPLVRLWRIVRELQRPGRPRHLLPTVLPLMTLALMADAAGEIAGYALGAGDSQRRLAGYEFDRWRYLTTEDRRSLAQMDEALP